MDDRAVHLLFSANRWEAKARIEETLAAGKHIVCDRLDCPHLAHLLPRNPLSPT